MVKKAIVLSIILLGVLIGVFVVMTVVRSRSDQSTRPALLSPPVPYQSPSPPQQTTYPEYLLPSPETVGPEEPLLTYEKATLDQQEFSALTLELPISTDGYSIRFNFANSTFDVDIYSAQGMKEYQALRNRYPHLKDDLFNVQERVEDVKLP